MAYNGRQALDQLQHTPADLVLIDLEMPVMDGIELITEISQRHLASAVIIMSAKDAKLISSVGVMAEAWVACAGLLPEAYYGRNPA